MASYRVCHLTLVQAREFESKGIKPDCNFHRHLSPKEAHHLVASERTPDNRPIEGYGLARWVGEGYRMICDVPFRTPRGHRGSMQWLRGDVEGRQGQFHYPVPAMGDHRIAWQHRFMEARTDGD